MKKLSSSDKTLSLSPDDLKKFASYFTILMEIDQKIERNQRLSSRIENEAL